MRGPASRFTPEQVELLQQMVATGHSGIAIAAALGVTPLAVRVKCCALGLRLRPLKKSDELRFKVEPAVAARLREEARRRNTTTNGLARQLLTMIAWDGLFAAVLPVTSSAVGK